MYQLINDAAGFSLDYDVLTVGETPYTHEPELILPYVIPTHNELQMCFHFHFHNIDGSKNHSGMKPMSWTLSKMKEIVAKWQFAMHERGGWNAI
jgi:oligo-1,6-glucosidase